MRHNTTNDSADHSHDFQEPYFELSKEHQAILRGKPTRNLLQPVLLIGPTDSGKSSLVKRLTDPNNFEELTPTKKIKENAATILMAKNHHFRREEKYGSPVGVLRVTVVPGHVFTDVPGAVGARVTALENIREMAQKFREKTKRGIIVACFVGGPDPEERLLVREHYMSTQWEEFKLDIKRIGVPIDKAVVVLNKFDCWLACISNSNGYSFSKFTNYKAFIESECKGEVGKICELAGKKNTVSVVTILGRSASGGAKKKEADAVEFSDMNVSHLYGRLTQSMEEYCKEQKDISSSDQVDLRSY